jgi:hypothetical protein
LQIEIRRKGKMKRAIIVVVGLLLLSLAVGDFTPTVQAEYQSQTIEWKGWWVGDTRVTVALLSETVTAKVRLNNEPSGYYRIRIMRDIAGWPDEEIEKLEFDYDSSDRTYSLSFKPTKATDEENTRGYHVDVYKKEWWGWEEKWTLLNFYPPRLRVYRTKAIRWTYYHSYAEIEFWLRSLESSGIAKVESIGVSVEGRQIWAIKISDEPYVDDKNEPDILFVGLHHAREWISAEVPFYLAVNLVQNYHSDSNIKTLVDNSEIWVVPVLNPDGLEYSQAGVWDAEIGDWSRYWRKNRRDNGDGSHGVDLNRNYNHSKWGTPTYTYWLGIPYPTSSGVSSSDVYWGPTPFSETETFAIKNLILDDRKNFEAVLSYHSYGQYILYPWGWTKADPPKASLLSVLAEEMSDQIYKVHGKRYTAGQSSTTIYETSGDLTDWVYEVKGIPAFTIELRPEPHPWWALWEEGKERFHLSENEILPTCEENWAAAIYLIRWVVLSQGGFMDFEDGVDEMPIRSTIPGMMFTTTMGYDWVYGDIRTGKYNVYPYGHGGYECHGNFFAWLGPYQGLGRIDFTGATARTVSMLTSTHYGTYLEAYDSNGNLLASDYAGPNTFTRTMTEIKVTAPNIAYVIVHDTGNYWLIDDLRVRDLLRETNAFQPPESTSIFQTLDTIDNEATSSYQFTNDQQQTLKILLNWQGSTFGVQVLRPGGSIFCETESSNPPIRIVVPMAEVGTWTILVTAIDVPHDDYPFAIDVASIPTPADSIPPSTILTIGDPKYLDPSDNVYVTSHTPFTLSAEDNVGGSGVATTGYRIRNTTYDSGWITSTPPIEFYLTGLADGAYLIDYNSTDNAGNIEKTHTVSVILDNSGPSITIENPPPGWALQDGVNLIALSTDPSGTHSLNFSIREANGDQGIPVGFEDMPATYNTTTGKWELFFNTLQLPDGFYIVIVSAEDNLGHIASITVPYSIRNWVVLELLPATPNNKAGRTMPVKFALRVAASVDPNQPFVYNEELTIKIYATDNPSNILQTSTFGDTARDYRINIISEQYITNFQTLKTPKTYTVEIWRKNMLIGSFNFKTVK